MTCYCHSSFINARMHINPTKLARKIACITSTSTLNNQSLLRPPIPRAFISNVDELNLNNSSEDDELIIDIPQPEHIKIEDRFPASFDENLIADLRNHFDERYDDPLKATANRFVWDPWHIPGQYSLLRTPADSFFPQDLYDRLEDALIEFGERSLGCRGISPVWLSVYTDGAHQEIHTDSPHGPWAFVLSLTRWEQRTFSGGETTLLKPTILDYWRHFDASKGMETPQICTCIEPLFGRLTVFDARIPHWVREVSASSRDIRQGRIILHGWFTSPTPFFDGALDNEDITPVLNESLEELYGALSSIECGYGTVVARLKIGGESGRVEKFEFLTNTLMMPGGVVDVEGAREEVLTCIVDVLSEMEFAPLGDGGGETDLTVPFVFE